MIDGSKNDEKLYYFLFISKYQTVLLFLSRSMERSTSFLSAAIYLSNKKIMKLSGENNRNNRNSLSCN